MESEKKEMYSGVNLETFVPLLGEWIVGSGFCGCTKKEQGSVLALELISAGKAPLWLASRYHIISGKISLKADAMLALFRERGGRVKWIKFDNDAAQADFTIEGQTSTISYTASDATRAKLLPPRNAESGWAKHPAEMLRARLISKAIRMVCPEVCAGIYTPEEVEDFKITEPVTALLNTSKERALKTVQEVLDYSGLSNESVDFMMQSGWIKSSIDELDQVRKNKILCNPDAFIAMVKAKKGVA